MHSSQSRKSLSVSLVKRFGSAECRCESDEHAQCKDVGKCARVAVLSAGRALIRDLEGLGLRQKEIAHHAGIHPAVLNRWKNEQEEPRLGLKKLDAAIEKMQEALIDVGREHLVKAAATQALPIKAIDFMHARNDTDRLRCQAEDVVGTNLVSAIVGLPVSDKKHLPDGVPATVCQIGDPRYHLYIISLEDPDGTEHLAAKIKIYDNLLHELTHIMDRYKDRRNQLARNKRRPNPPTLRLS